MCSRWALLPILLWAAAAAAQGLNSAIERGRYLAQAGDCAACHTAEGSAPFAGGRPIPTPFGTIFSTNITPDKDTGIGSWSEEDFYLAMHEGKRRGGEHLYPAFPYPWYTKLSRADVDALKAYLDTLTPVRLVNRKTELPWPFSVRSVMSGWNAMFFHEGEYKPDPARTAEWNRGAYLVDGLGHCGACHTPKNIAGGLKTSERLEGGYGEHWYATSLTNDVRDGIGGWSTEEIVQFLKTGANDKAAATGPMAEVVHNSTQHLSDADARAMAVYLKSLPGKSQAKTPESDGALLAQGKAVYADQCAGCHMEDGEGQAHVFPPLKGNAIVQASDPETMVHMILGGARVAATAQNPTALAMPAFGWKLSDAEVAALASYLRGAWGNSAAPVSEPDVDKVRKQIARSSP